MKETLQDIKTRRSCRKFQSRQIADEELNAILEAGTWAPTGHGCQSPVMVLVQDKPTLAKLSKLNAAILGVNSDPFYAAPTVIVVLADSSYPTYREDGTLVMGDLLLAAHAVGVGSCWIHRAREVFETEEGKELLRSWGLGSNYVGIGHCALGYAAENGEAPAKPRKERYVIRV